MAVRSGGSIVATDLSYRRRGHTGSLVASSSPGMDSMSSPRGSSWRWSMLVSFRATFISTEPGPLLDNSAATRQFPTERDPGGHKSDSAVIPYVYLPR